MKKLIAFLVYFALFSTACAWASLSLIGLNNYGPLANPIYLWDGRLLPKEDAYVEIISASPWVTIVPVNDTSEPIKLTEDGFFDAGYGFIPGMNGYATTEFVLTAYQWVENYLQPMGSVQWTQKTGGWLGPPYLPFLVDLENPPLHFIPEPSTVVLGLMGGACLFTFCHKRNRKNPCGLTLRWKCFYPK